MDSVLEKKQAGMLGRMLVVLMESRLGEILVEKLEYPMELKKVENLDSCLVEKKVVRTVALRAVW